MAAIRIGTSAPDFSFVDSAATRSLAQFRGSNVIVAFTHHAQRTQPVLQFLTFEGERVPVVAPTDESVARLYGVNQHPAVFVIDAGGTIAWRHALEDGDSIPQPAVTNWSRREFITVMLAASIAATLASTASVVASTPGAATAGTAEAVNLAFTVNGRPVRLAVDPRVTLLDALRERLRFTGTKKGCDHGQCGACTAHVEGRRVLSCLTLAATVDGKSVLTIEGLARGDALHAMQQAFIDNDGFQCGYCTAGQIMSAVGLLNEPCGASDDDVRECMSGNICRCGAYPGIVAAIQSVRGRQT
jgi:xanthine dehydrogenase YagT iron-sulfur-binding subunit